VSLTDLSGGLVLEVKEVLGKSIDHSYREDCYGCRLNAKTFLLTNQEKGKDKKGETEKYRGKRINNMYIMKRDMKK